ncbi:cytochrome c oxidase subunit 6A2, mitochondrial [Chrysoperla carnea]|uniref:cytochrome c oxidase subunit 6A2, mitochondrial n=1 Tax=Chrysoperla carnea TaxID=189513 RepID=UPI001D08CAEF|nr:cytochrome c oxidase subunit 6A2, mitochondrial [Chrysoperla carnea]
MANLINHSIRRYIATNVARNAQVQGTAATAGHHDGWKMWKNMSLFLAFPAIAVCMVNVYLAHGQHHERAEFVPYEHMRIRNKRFPWGDGQRSLFHNPHVNPLPSGYEEEH